MVVKTKSGYFCIFYKQYQDMEFNYSEIHLLFWS